MKDMKMSKRGCAPPSTSGKKDEPMIGIWVRNLFNGPWRKAGCARLGCVNWALRDYRERGLDATSISIPS